MIALLLLEEKKEGKKILLGRNGKECRLPELPDIRFDGLCDETRTVYELNGCYCYGHTCVPFHSCLKRVGMASCLRGTRTP
jgi:hypothetical protein